jgi:carboxyl-terminal processing protease
MDNGRARVVGTPTFGKNVAYLRFDIDGGGILQITTDILTTPKGIDVSKGGIKPHVIVRQGRDRSDRQLQAAICELKKLIK